ncbi:nuclear factor 1 B-type-like isoform X1 [Lates japonicus]|uniref:Nuclear factor 1 B-type-like isoform X1 n=1 Tax=Lates japonicus TaxID=270547 RepID=A0AAD3NEL2_LATJO|nr:nuclear factor 1 B-type-like isoform X1 [Lates japonicus]
MSSPTMKSLGCCQPHLSPSPRLSTFPWPHHQPTGVGTQCYIDQEPLHTAPVPASAILPSAPGRLTSRDTTILPPAPPQPSSGSSRANVILIWPSPQSSQVLPLSPGTSTANRFVGLSPRDPTSSTSNRKDPNPQSARICLLTFPCSVPLFPAACATLMCRVPADRWRAPRGAVAPSVWPSPHILSKLLSGWRLRKCDWSVTQNGRHYGPSATDDTLGITWQSPGTWASLVPFQVSSNGTPILPTNVHQNYSINIIGEPLVPAETGN